jgi:hypothetical protein
MIVLKDYPNYSITKDGKVFSHKTNKFLSNRNNKKRGYNYVVLYANNKHKNILVHRLVAIAYLQNPLNKRCVNHINGIKTDNRVENLEWNTHSENSKHAYKNGLVKISNLCNQNKVKANSKLVVNLLNGIFYDSVKEASIISGINYNTLMGYLGKHKTNKSTFIYI